MIMAICVRKVRRDGTVSKRNWFYKRYHLLLFFQRDCWEWSMRNVFVWIQRLADENIPFCWPLIRAGNDDVQFQIPENSIAACLAFRTQIAYNIGIVVWLIAIRDRYGIAKTWPLIEWDLYIFLYIRCLVAWGSAIAPNRSPHPSFRHSNSGRLFPVPVNSKGGDM